ncbi:kunitz trypsin inhibitor 5 [Arachis duranensis]|uniref:Kunitz trypsin inhibitor 5 n=1 Tax=Arachis duranensis TaxID=130453 RepID=A0A6P4DCU5_ARADU|nr:kunitz trypsin inhibitor 5 [Arachis duranensis]
MKSSLSLAAIMICSAMMIGMAASAAEPVLDVTGQKLRSGVKYFILPVLRGRGGGLTVGSSVNSTCPIYVLQDKLEVTRGTPVTFTPSTPNKDGVILTSTDHNIKSTSAPKCKESSVWRLLKVLSGVWFISTDGVAGNPGVNTVVNWFKIEKDGKDYNLSFCPSVCNCSTLCRPLGIFTDSDGTKHLSLSDQVPTFKVMFKKA